MFQSFILACALVLVFGDVGIAQEPDRGVFYEEGPLNSLAVVIGPELKGSIAAMEAGDYFAAAAELRDLVYRDSTHVQALRLLASAFGHMGDYVQAIDVCRRLTQLNSVDAGVEVALGFFHQKLGDFEGAEQHYRQGLMRDKKVIQAYQGLGWIYLQQGRLEQALDMVTETTERAPNYAPNYLLMGRILTAQGFFEDAVVAYQRTFSLEGTLRKQYGILLQELQLRHHLRR
ncbi:MAG: tetratricopeptide repeat protein [bacterium]|nr:tetratricopeptide repeat protein [bacterium]